MFTFLFTDLEGSTQLWEQHPDSMRAALRRHDAILVGSVEAAGGRVVKTTGDGLHAVFDAAADAVPAVLDGQRALLAEPWGDLGPLRVRMALHSGEADARGGDFYGPAVNRAARLMAIAHGGQMLLSAACAQGVGRPLPEGASLADLGQHRLRDLSQPEHVFQLCAPGLPAEFPPLRSLAVFPTNLPMQLTRLIGREAELAEARRLLNQPGARLLTLTGPGGTGKTRLALQLAAEELDRFGDGAWLVELAPLADAEAVPAAVAAALGVRAPSGRTLLDALVDYLRGKHLLLLLDNCEHLVEACARLAETLLSRCPRLSLLASSREPLGIAGEQVFRVPSLALPSAVRGAAPDGPALLEAVRHSESGQLFAERASAGQAGFAINAHNSAAVAQIVQRLDGIPLAIELAAARVRLLSPEQILARLDDRFSLLTGGRRTALPRHQTLLAAIDWSYQLLSEPERALLRSLSVFVGGWLLEAAEQVGAGAGAPGAGAGAPGAGDGIPDGNEADPLELLSHLVDKSLVLVDAEHPGEPRYRLLETIRQFASARLVEAGEAALARDRHLAYYMRLAAIAEPLLIGSRQLEWLVRLEAEHDNLRAALSWSLDTQPETALRMAVSLVWFWQRHGHVRESSEWLLRALERVGEQADMALRGRALTGLAAARVNMGEHRAAAQDGQASVQALEAAGDESSLGFALGIWGMALIYAGDLPSAREALQRGEAIARAQNNPVSLTVVLSGLTQIAIWMNQDFKAARAYIEEELRLGQKAGDRWVRAEALFGIGLVSMAENDFAAAKSNLGEAYQLFDEINDRAFGTMALSGLADLARRQGDLELAETHYRQVIKNWQQTGHLPGIARCLECLALVAGARGDFERAGRLFGAAEALREQLDSDMMPDEKEEYAAELAALRGRLGDAARAFDAAWQAGREAGYEQSVDLAFSAQ